MEDTVCDRGETERGRIQGVDFFRVVAILAVISIHTSPFNGELSGQDSLYRFLYLMITPVATTK